MDVPLKDQGLTDQALTCELLTWAGRAAAAEARLVSLIGEFDAREAWAGAGVLSCAHWLSWQLGMGLAAARERVRVARVLRDGTLVLTLRVAPEQAQVVLAGLGLLREQVQGDRPRQSGPGLRPSPHPDPPVRLPARPEPRPHADRPHHDIPVPTQPTRPATPTRTGQAASRSTTPPCRPPGSATPLNLHYLISTLAPRILAASAEAPNGTATC